MNFTTFFNTITTGEVRLFILMILTLGLFALVVAWKVYEKTGRQGWKAIIPYYNEWVFYEMSGKPGWWMLAGFLTMFNTMHLAPSNHKAYYSAMILTNLPSYVLSFIASLELGKRFGKSRNFSIISLALVPFIGWPILAFSKAEYKLPKSKQVSISH